MPSVEMKVLGKIEDLNNLNGLFRSYIEKKGTNHPIGTVVGLFVRPPTQEEINAKISSWSVKGKAVGLPPLTNLSELNNYRKQLKNAKTMKKLEAVEQKRRLRAQEALRALEMQKKVLEDKEKELRRFANA